MAVYGIASVPFLLPQCNTVYSGLSQPRCFRSSSQRWGPSLGIQSQHALLQCNLMAPNPEVPKEKVVKRLLEALEKSGVNVQKVLREKGPSVKPNHWLLVLEEVGKQRRWLLALEIFRWMQLQKWYKPDKTYYWKMVFILGKEKQLRIAVRLLEEMKATGLRPSTSIYNAIIAAHVAMPDMPGNLDKAVSLLMEMKTTSSKTSQPDVLTYNSLIKAFAQVGDLYQVRSLFEDLQKAGMKPVVHTFNLIIDAYGKRGHLEKMEHMYGLMKAKKCKPDVVTFTSLIHAYCRAGEFGRAEGLLSLMIKSKKNQLEERPFNFLLDAYGQAGQVEKMEVVAVKLIGACLSPSAITFDIMIGAYGRTGSFDRMRECVETMKAARLTPSYATCKFMLEVLCEKKMFDWAEEALDDAFHSGLARDETLYVVVLKAYVLEGRSAEMERMLCKMQQVGVPFSRALLTDFLGSNSTGGSRLSSTASH